MATFQIKEHHVRGGGAAVCVYDDNMNFMATVCWREGNIVVISKYIQNVVLDRQFPAAAVIQLNAAG